MLTESAVLAAFSGLLGVLLAAVSLNALKLVLPPDTPRLANLALHGDVFLFAAAVSLLTGVLAGLVPALEAGNQDLHGSLRSSASNVFGNRHRFRVSRLLVVGQIALAVVVITAAGVMLRSLHKLSTTDPGFRARQTLTAQVSLDRDACAQKGACTDFFVNLLNRAEGMPGVDAAALVDALPMTGYDTWFVFDAEDHPRTPRQLALEASSRTVSPSYFGLMGIRLLRGRLLTADDRSGGTRAVLVNEAEANALWPNQDPIGKHLISVGDEPSPAVMDLKKSLTVVGVVSDTRHQSLDKASGWETYLPMTTATMAATQEKPVMNILLRSPLSSIELAASLRALVEQVNPSAPVTKVRTLESVVSSSAAAPRSLTMLLTAFGALAILVGAIGVYSLISYTVSWRTREIGLRLALGANRNQIAKFVLGQSLAVAATGSALGIVGALATTRLMRRFLFETSAIDPLTYSLVPVLFCVLALLAAWAPARRAAAVDPIIALRNE